jgi:uncharacterized damage-inducible protein DinB
MSARDGTAQPGAIQAGLEGGPEATALPEQGNVMLVTTSLEHLAVPPVVASLPVLTSTSFRRLPVRDLDLPPQRPMPIRLADLLRAFDTARARTSRLAALIPEASLDWAPAPGAFSCADVVRHLAATERFMFVEIALGRRSSYPGHSRSLAYGREGILAYLTAMHLQSMTLLQTLDGSALERKVTTPSGAQIPTWRWLQLMAEHEAHHRGQLYLMLRLLGVATPPLFGLTEEQLLEKSSN